MRFGRVKGWTALLAFFLGVTLTLGTVGQTACQILLERDLSPRWTRDWQDTDNFRMEVASVLRDFLTIGAGGELDLYETSYYWTDEIVEEAVHGGYGDGWWWDYGDYGTATSDASAAPDGPAELDAAYRHDKNVLYRIDGSGKTYTNCEEGDVSALEKRTLEGYNFYLTFRDGKASIVLNGEALDVYGGGIYEGDPQWFVPGYENFPSTDQLKGVTVRMAVRETPIRYHYVDYKTGRSYGASCFYYIAQRAEESRTFYRTQAAVLALGVVCLAVWLALRKARPLADRKIASWTVHIWTEGRCLIFLLLIAGTVLASDWERLYWQWRELWWSWYDGGQLWVGQLLYGLLAFLISAFPALLGLGWFAWLIHNDHRYNPREARRSLLRPFFRALRARDLKRSVEKRIGRSASLLGLAVLALGVEVLFFLIVSTVDGSPWPVWALWTWFLLPVLLAVLAAFALTRRQYRLAKDIGLLADQVEAVRAGDLATPLVLPENADLRATADSLNDIQAGMKAALEDQTRSERMKVELVSNVSHDLKTPLTSILSYAELLRQEDLPPAASDYARVVEEKAQRLKAMVQDVFEVSRAASDQLPVHPERIDLGKLLRQTLADMDGPIRESALSFKVDLPERPVPICADGKRLYRVFQNLIDNALRYALEGSRVYLSLKTAEGTAEASVCNTSRDELPAGVDFTARFVRGDESRTDGGSGLGLSIAKSFTEACGGTFRVETVADLFTAVVTFPLAEEEPAEEEPRT